MWKLIKWLFLIAIVAAIILWFTDVKIKGRSLKDRHNEFKQTTLYKEGIKDIRSIVGEALKALGEEVSGEVTDEERKQLENLIKEQMTPEKPVGEPGEPGSQTKTEGTTPWQQQPLKPLPTPKIPDQPAR